MHNIIEKYALPCFMVFFALLFCAYFSHDLVYDDILLVGNNTTLSTNSSYLDVFSQHLWEGTPQVDDSQGSYYRPLMIFSLLWDVQLWGTSYQLHHIQSLLWHLLCCALFYFWSKPYLHTRMAQVIAICCFAIHPAQIEGVTFLSARNDTMACAGLLGMMLALHYQKYAVASIALLCALLSKESALLIPFVWIGMSYWEKRSIPRWGVLSIFSGFAAYGILRFGAGIPWPSSSQGSFLQLSTGILIYCDHLVFPDMLLPATHVLWPSNKELVGGSIGLLCMIGMILFARKERLWSMVLLIAGILPAFAAIGQTGLAADRYLYIPMLGFSMLLGNTLSRHIKNIHIFGIILIILYTVQSARILPHWKSNVSLFSKAAQVHNSPYQSGALAKALEEEGRIDEAAFWYEKAVSPPLPYQHSCYNITWIHLLRGDMDQIIKSGESALLAGCEPSAELNAPLALAYVTQGQWKKAQTILNQSTRDPRNIFRLVRLCLMVHQRDVAVLSMPNFQPAKEDIGKLLEQSDTQAVAWMNSIPNSDH
ncbi:MAG: hypothetical protein CL916_05225 [Deltaproteobacteria bacterium]|nr:hypothetical protein [Deltaproteobacteria bacterium]